MVYISSCLFLNDLIFFFFCLIANIWIAPNIKCY